VLADTVTPEFAGKIYCAIILICEDLADLPEPGWTAVTELAGVVRTR
jgi:hypothetical protein